MLKAHSFVCLFFLGGGDGGGRGGKGVAMVTTRT